MISFSKIFDGQLNVEFMLNVNKIWTVPYLKQYNVYNTSITCWIHEKNDVGKQKTIAVLSILKWYRGFGGNTLVVHCILSNNWNAIIHHIEFCRRKLTSANTWDAVGQKNDTHARTTIDILSCERYLYICLSGAKIGYFSRRPILVLCFITLQAGKEERNPVIICTVVHRVLVSLDENFNKNFTVDLLSLKLISMVWLWCL